MRRIGTFLVALLIACLPAVAGAEPTLDELRQSGEVAERYDGFVVVRDESAGAATRALVESVNAKRREIYETRAKKESAPLAEVGKVYALEIYEKAPAGTWFLGEDQKSTRKK